MSTSLSLTTNNYKLTNALRFINAFYDTDYYYLFTGVSAPYVYDIIPTPYDDVQTTLIDSWRTMEFGKLISSNNISLMVYNYPYNAGTIYVPYDDSNPLITQQQFYCVVNATSNYHVYKCLDNAGGSPSTIQPSFTSVDAYNDSFKTSDGYTWKYMFTVPVDVYTTFNTNDYIPFVSNNNVKLLATPGSIDSINVVSAGSGYSNYLNGTFSISDIALSGNSYIYGITSSASPLMSFYDECYISIIADPSGNSAGQYRKIEAYSVNSTARYIQLDVPFNPQPQNGAQYQIYPGVIITGDGTETVAAAAQAVINATSGNTVAYIDILEKGLNYKYTQANIFASDMVGVTANASLRVIYSPAGGHGANVAAELGSSIVGLSVSFTQAEGGNIPTSIQYQRIGLLKNPQFANVTCTLTAQNTNFLLTENVYKIKPLQIQATGTSNTSSANITATGSSFTNQFINGHPILISNGSVYQLSTVVSVSNNTVLTISSNCTLNSSNLALYTTDLIATGIIQEAYANTIIINNMSGFINTGDTVIGGLSGCYGTIGTVSRGGVQKDYSTFIQANKYQSLTTVGTFIENEIITQGSSYGTLTSISNTSGTLTFLVTNQVGSINASANVIGNTSGASATFTSSQQPELVFGTGDIEYIENFNAIERTPLQTENFKIMLNF